MVCNIFLSCSKNTFPNKNMTIHFFCKNLWSPFIHWDKEYELKTSIICICQSKMSLMAHCKILPLERTLFCLGVETKYDYGLWLATYSCALCTIQIMSPSPKLWETEFQNYGIFLKTINFSNFSTKNHSEW